MKNKIIIFDIDGTAVDSPKQKLPTTDLVEAIKKIENRYYLCPATGRCLTFAKDILKSLNIKDLCILSGGTQIYDPQTEKIVWKKDIESKALETVINIFKKTNGKQRLIYNDYTEDDYFFGGVLPHDFNTNQKVNWLSQSFVPESLAIKMYQELNTVKGISCVMVVAQKPNTRDLHIVNSKATKEHAITELLKRVGLNKVASIGIGDGHNDLHLFNAVKLKVAMGNAVEELKKSANITIKPVQEDGLARYFESLF
jgi:Cof subfamily protein (haloacid dehalogenase superfamily)